MSTRSSQGNAVQKELEILRQQHLAKNQRDKLKDGAFSMIILLL